MLAARDMAVGDIPACVEIINHIIALGGSTAHEETFTAVTFAQHYFSDPDIATVVTDGARIVGFQALYRGDNASTFYIGSFTDRRDPVPGAGRVMMDRSVSVCRAAGGSEIIAKITSDNTGGLAYYEKMGFKDIAFEPAQMTRRDGTTVDRFVKRRAL